MNRTRGWWAVLVAIAVSAGGSHAALERPGAPTDLIVRGASGTNNLVNTDHPLFQWNTPKGGAQAYQLQVWRNGRLFKRDWADATPDNATAIFMFGGPLNGFMPGLYKATVSAQNPGGLSLPSAPYNFEIAGGVTETPELRYPLGEVNRVFWFGWNGVIDATKYQLTVKRGGSTILSKTIGPQLGSWGGETWWNYPATEYWMMNITSPSQILPLGTNYSFSVSAYTPRGGWGAPASAGFQIRNYPVGDSMDMGVDQYFPPTDSWSLSPRPFFSAFADGATWYYFDIKRLVGTYLSSVARGWSTDDQGWQFHRDLPAGKYVWTVRGWSMAGGYGRPATQTVDLVSVSQPDAPSNLYRRTWGGAGADDLPCRPAFGWDLVNDVFRYQIEVQRNGMPFYMSQLLDIEATTANFVCFDNGGASAVYWRPQRTVPDGDYTFRVRSYNGMSATNYSAWSEWEGPHKVNTVLSGTPTVLWPTGTVSSGEGMIFQWQAVENAASYFVNWRMTSPESQTHLTGDVGGESYEVVDGTTVVVQKLAWTIQNGSYTLTVTPVNARGVRGIPATGTFTIIPPP